MATQHLFQLGMDLETGTTQTEDKLAVDDNVVSLTDRLLDEDRDDHFVRREGKVFAGTHLIIEVIGGKGLDCIETIEAAFRDCVEACQATLLHIHLHRFSPQGISGVAVLAESHISVHTWPEAEYAAFDVFMCGDADPWKAVDILRAAFNADEIKVDELLRGEGVV
jgi:S-adenosylmethionine decarboxylase